MSTTSNVTTQEVFTATSSADGLATANDVKTYVDTKSEVVNADATIVANDSTSAEIATIGGTSVTAKVKLLWDEWEVPAPHPRT